MTDDPWDDHDEEETARPGALVLFFRFMRGRGGALVVLLFVLLAVAALLLKLRGG